MMPFNLHPDKFQRYQHAASILRSLSFFNDSTVLLDLGAWEGILQHFFPQNVIFQLDIAYKIPSSSLICGDAKHLPLQDQSIDVVFALDLLEHIAPKERLRVIQEVTRVSKSAVIFSYPDNTENNADAEIVLNSIEMEVRGVPNEFLKEHNLFGAVDTNAVIAGLDQRYSYTAQLPNFQTSSWLLANIIDSYLSILPDALELATTLYTLFNSIHYSFSRKFPTYRLLIIGSSVPIPETLIPPKFPDLDKILTKLHPAVTKVFKTLESLDHYAQKLQQDVTDTKIEYHMLETSHNKMVSQFNSLKENFRDQEALHENFLKLEVAYKKLETAFEELNSTFRNLENSYSVLEQNYKNLESEYFKIEELYREAVQNNEKNISSLNDSISQYQELEVTHLELKNSFSELELEYKNLESQFLEGQVELTKSCDEVVILKTENQKASLAYSGLHREYRKLERAYLDKLHDSDETLIQIKDYARECQTIRDYVNKLEEQMKSDKALIHLLLQRTTTLEMQLLHLQDLNSHTEDNGSNDIGENIT